MEPREGREEEERGREGGRRGEAHNAMGHGGWTDSICSQLSVALVMDGELGETPRAREGGRQEKFEEATIIGSVLSLFGHFKKKKKKANQINSVDNIRGRN